MNNAILFRTEVFTHPISTQTATQTLRCDDNYDEENAEEI